MVVPVGSDRQAWRQDADPVGLGVVPGKVLGTGNLEKKLNVGAFSFSASARSKIERAGGKTFSVEEFVKKYPAGSGVALVK